LLTGLLTGLLRGVTDKNIFCNTPWYELHVYWDGSLGICCQEDHKLYSTTDTQYNITTMTIQEWFNSEPVKKFRSDILGNNRLSECRRCYTEEDHGGNSRRLKSNQKSVIFTRTAFDESFKQSPGHGHFLKSVNEQGLTDTHPIDLHIDLGNFCNLACKMCNPMASSTIASQQVKWGIDSSRRYLGTDWTRNKTVWHSFKQQLLNLPKLNNIHFMGGETLLTDQFEDLVDTMIEHNKFDLCFSFVTNGTVFRPELLDKLKLFRRVGIEVSIEAMDEHNSYQRQGTDTGLVLKNIKRYQQWCDGTSITVALRPAPSLLSIGYYVDLLQYALDNQFIVKSNLCFSPRFLSAEILPESIKQQYQLKYLKFLNQLADVKVDSDYNTSDPNNHRLAITEQANMCLAVLQTPTPSDSETQLAEMVRHCERWDRVYGYDARKLYPEFQEILDQYNYNVSS
jgi:pyruvate-formate lyase-activating enzyme